MADSLQAGDVPPVAVEMIRCLHPDAEWRTALTGVTYRGPIDMARGFDELVEAARAYRVELKEVTDLGGGLVLATVARSGADAMARVAHVFAFRDDKLVTFTELRDVDEALEAAGLRE